MQFIPLQEIKGKNKVSLIKFLIQYEDKCVQLTSLLKKNISCSYVVYVNEVKPEDLYGVISIKKTILYLLPFVNSRQETALQEDFVQSFREFYKSEKFEKPVCINGEMDGMKLILKAFGESGIKPDQLNEYNLMKLDVKSFLQNLKKEGKLKMEEVQVLRCKKDLQEDLKRQLVQLQFEYELEEVLPECFDFDEDSCRLRFYGALRSQYILSLKNISEQLVAKAGTNAVGLKTVQIGGVFTKKEFRGKHYGSFLMKMLLFRIVRMKRNVVLFVKIKNPAANNLYNSLSFKKIGSYSIAYFT